jgi:hypothetical protein
MMTVNISVGSFTTLRQYAVKCYDNWRENELERIWKGMVMTLNFALASND